MRTNNYPRNQGKLSTNTLSFSLGDQGSANLWAMLFCVIAITCYIKVGKEYLDSTIPDLHHLVIVLTLAIVTVFTTGCAIHLIFVGDKSSGHLRKDLVKQNEELARFVVSAQKRVRDFEAEALRRSGTIRPQCLEAIGQARRLVNAMGRRGDEIRKLLSSRNRLALIDAHELMGQPLSVTENCIDSLIGADPVPPINSEDWLPTIDRLFIQVENDLSHAQVAA